MEATPPEIAEPVALVPPPEPPLLDPPDPPLLDEPPPEDRLELPEEPPLLNEPDGPPRPNPLRLPRICGVSSETNFSAWVVPVSRRTCSTVPLSAVKILVTVWVVVTSLGLVRVYIHAAPPTAAANSSSHHFPDPPGSGACGTGEGAATGCGGATAGADGRECGSETCGCTEILVTAESDAGRQTRPALQGERTVRRVSL